jgi:hypothetical protein
MNVLAQIRVRELCYPVGFCLRSTGLLEGIRHTISTQFSSGYITLGQHFRKIGSTIAPRSHITESQILRTSISV